jgi:hypothetical protein
LAAPALAQELDWRRDPTSQRWFAQALHPTRWSEARDWARSYGAELASVRTAGEQAWLTGEFFATTPAWGFHWLGLFQDTTAPGYAEPAAGWSWIGGAPLTFTAWRSGAPDDLSGGENYARTLGAWDALEPGAWEDSRERVTSAPPEPLLDWYIGPGQVVWFNTAAQALTLGQLSIATSNAGFPNAQNATINTSFAPTQLRTFSGGRVEVRRFYVEQGGALVLLGPNRFELVASDSVWIRGAIIADGGHAPEASAQVFRGPVDTATGFPVTTSNHVANGGVGVAGGGSGGTGLPDAVSPNPIGGAGEGAFGTTVGGGRGGHSGIGGFWPVSGRRGGGGGGGRFGSDTPAPPGLVGPFDQRRIGLDAERGFDNPLTVASLVSGPGPTFGGAAGTQVFSDASADNDFCGVARDTLSGAFVLGELLQPWAGSGGGAGGSGLISWGGQPQPAPIYYPHGNSFGGGGGGGGGSLRVRALGPILFGVAGQIRARGGTGSGGSIAPLFDRGGGGGGGGSGGHVILDSAARIDLRALGTSGTLLAADVRGGQGGPGVQNLGGRVFGANGYVETTPQLDACPAGYPASGANACRGPVHGAGGDGGPGVIQLHTPMGSPGATPNVYDILIADGATLSNLFTPPPLFASSSSTLRPLASAGGGLGLFELDSPDCDGDGEPDRAQVFADVQLDLDSDGALDSCQGVVRYCWSGLTSDGCAPLLVASGVASATATSGFELRLEQVRGGRRAALFASRGAVLPPFQPGALCLAPPLVRLLVGPASGSSAACGAALSLDWNTWNSSHPGSFGAALAAGDRVHVQAWVRDPGAAGGSVASDALRFTLAP